jgi:hypothetical protein
VLHGFYPTDVEGLELLEDALEITVCVFQKHLEFFAFCLGIEGSLLNSANFVLLYLDVLLGPAIVLLDDLDLVLNASVILVHRVSRFH